MYDPKIQFGLNMFNDLCNKHAHELYFAELTWKKIVYGDGFEQIHPEAVLEFKR